MGGKGRKGKEHSHKINVEIAPGNQARMARFIEAYNTRPDRRTPKLKYTDVVNEALDRFLEARLVPLREKIRRSRKR
jgi:hypothetical protein